jgi:small-conductance mechanosensitive channel
MNNYTYADAAYIISQSPVLSWVAILFGSAFIAGLIKLVLRFISSRLRRITKTTHSAWDDVGLDVVDGLRTWVLFVWAVFVFAKSMKQPEPIQRLLLLAIVLASSFQFILWGLYLIRSWRKNVLEKRAENDPSSASAIGLVSTTLQAAFLLLMALIALSNLGVNVSALIAGLGVGGIAVALAAQNVLGDLLASLSIVLDKPFVVGDFIVTRTEMGTVEQIGVKTTRLRALSGEELILSNKDLLESRIQNFKRMYERRVVQKFGVTYGTPIEKLQVISKWVKEFVLKHDKLRFDRCHFASYGASSLDFEFVFYVLDPDFNFYMDLQQIILLDIFQKFQTEGIEFAYPTQTVFVEKFPHDAPGTTAGGNRASATP